MKTIILEKTFDEAILLKIKDDFLTLLKIDKSNKILEKFTLKKINTMMCLSNILINHVQQRYANSTYATKKVLGVNQRNES